MVQDAIRSIPVMTFLAYRFSIAAVAVAVMFRKEVRGLSREGVKAGLWMGVFLTAGYIFQTFGLERTTASNAGFITGLFVVLTPLFAAVFLRQSVPSTAWIAATVSAIGLFLLTGAGGGEGNLAGDALVFGCACSFACHILVSDRAVKDHSLGGLLVIQIGFCGAFCALVTLVMGDFVVPRGDEVWAALIVTSLLASALGFYVQAWAQRHASPARTALILASEPAFAGLFAYLLQDEVLGATEWAGAALDPGRHSHGRSRPLPTPHPPPPRGLDRAAIALRVEELRAAKALDALLYRWMRREQLCERCAAAGQWIDYVFALLCGLHVHRDATGSLVELLEGAGERLAVADELGPHAVCLELPRPGDRHLDHAGRKRGEDHHQQSGERVAVVIVAAEEEGEVGEVADRRGDGSRNRADQDVVVLDVGELVGENSSHLVWAEDLGAAPGSPQPPRGARCGRLQTHWAAGRG